MQEPAAQGAPKGVDSCLFVCRGDDQEKEKDSKSLSSFFGDLFRPLQFAVACLSLL
jgi:hypothetical protein